MAQQKKLSLLQKCVKKGIGSGSRKFGIGITAGEETDEALSIVQRIPEIASEYAIVELEAQSTS